MPTPPPEDAPAPTGDFVGIPEDSSSVPMEEPATSLPAWLPLALGCGCVGIPVLVVILGLSGITHTFLRLYRSTGSYQVYQVAAEQVKQAPAVRSTLGEPIEPGWVAKSSEHYDDTTEGQVCQQFKVTGQQRQGRVYVEAQRMQGTWQIHQLYVEVNDQPDPIILKPLDQGAKSLCPDF